LDDGNGTSGGGHLVVNAQKTTLLDDYKLTPEVACPRAYDFNVFTETLTAEAARQLQEHIDLVSKRYSRFGDRLQRDLRAISWKACPDPLPFVNDHASEVVITGDLQQAAIGFGGVVVFDHNLLVQSVATFRPSAEYKSPTDLVKGLLAHELLIDYLGKNAPRESLRKISRALREPEGVENGSLWWSLNEISPAISRGETLIEVRVGEGGRNPRSGFEGTAFLVDCATGEKAGQIQVPWTYRAPKSGPQPSLRTLCIRTANVSPGGDIYIPAVEEAFHWEIVVNGVVHESGAGTTLPRTTGFWFRSSTRPIRIP
jgi:hypothetical protein